MADLPSSDEPGAAGVEFWRLGMGYPRDVVRVAERCEDWGWDGLLLVDSQNLCGDCYVELTRIAMSTDRIGLGTGVTNPRTRHAAVTASAAASLQATSKGRFVLGIGRGDSSLANIGLAPVAPAELADYVRQLRGYLGGDDVPFTASTVPGERTIDEVPLGDRPRASRLRWLARLPASPVPIEIFASGPRVLRLAGAVADRVMVAVGAEPARVAWAVGQVRSGAEAAGRTQPPRIGAYVNVVCHPDFDTAFTLGQGRLAAHARFSVLHGDPAGPVREDDRETLLALRRRYDMNRHSSATASHGKAVTAEFARRFAVLGPPSYCVERMAALRAAGVDHFAVGGPSFAVDPREAADAIQRMSFEVLPALR